MNTRMMPGGQAYVPSHAMMSPPGRYPGAWSSTRTWRTHPAKLASAKDRPAPQSTHPIRRVVRAAGGDQSPDDGERQDRRHPQKAEDVQRGLRRLRSARAPAIATIVTRHIDQAKLGCRWRPHEGLPLRWILSAHERRGKSATPHNLVRTAQIVAWCWHSAVRNRERLAKPAEAYGWALRDSNPRPSPCKGDRNMQVSGLSWENVVTLGTCEYLGVPVSRGARVVHRLSP